MSSNPAAKRPIDDVDGDSSDSDSSDMFDAIRTALEHGKAHVCCQGSVQLDQPPVIFGEDALGALFAVHLPLKDAACGSDGVAREALQPLLDACIPAKFGRGCEEVLDGSYRKALALPVDRCATTFNLAAHNLLPDVHELLMPDAPRVAARLHKLNVYGPDGFFKAHKDTPRSDDQFGSLVVCLPVPHVGGALVIRHKDAEQARTKWGAEADARDNIARWAAFYSDCEHEVEPVKSGHRVTLTYALTAETGDDDDALGQRLRVSEDAAHGSALHAALTHAMKDPHFLPDGGTLGIACSHEYALNIGASRGVKPRKSTQLTPDMLKGVDSLTYTVGSILDLKPSVHFVFNLDDMHDDEDGAGTMLLPGTRGAIMQSICPYHDDSSEWGVLHEAGAKNACFVHWLNEENLNFKIEHSYMTYGNEASVETMYSAAAILLDLPPHLWTTGRDAPAPPADDGSDDGKTETAI